MKRSVLTVLTIALLAVAVCPVFAESQAAIRNASGSRLGYIDGNDIRDASGSRVGSIDGNAAKAQKGAAGIALLKIFRKK